MSSMLVDLSDCQELSLLGREKTCLPDNLMEMIVIPNMIDVN